MKLLYDVPMQTKQACSIEAGVGWAWNDSIDLLHRWPDKAESVGHEAIRGL